MMMNAIVFQDEVTLPAWVVDLPSFRRWARADYPERGQVFYLNGAVWVDLSMERLAHNQVKAAVLVALSVLAQSAKLGIVVADRMMLTNVLASLSTEPDGMFLSYKSLRAKRVRLEEGDDSLEVEGSPDMVLEVISPTSERKDVVLLRDLYWQAGIREYWLIDPREDPTRLDILRHTAKGYTAVGERQGGWIKSVVFGKWFRLTQQRDKSGLTEYQLEVK
jgi:Uma2 family endonuclease